MRGDTAWSWMVTVLSGKPVTDTYVGKFADALAVQLGGVKGVTHVKAK